MAYNTQIPHLDTEGYKQSILTQNNPFLEGLLGKNGILGFLENQEKRMQASRKSELINKLLRDPNSVDEAINAQNNKADYRKAMLGNKYFIDSNDEDLNAAIDAVNTLKDNRIKSDYEKAVNSAIGLDNYKAGDSNKVLESLGYSNVGKGILDTLGEYDQTALQKRYQDEILQKLADNQVLNGRISPEAANEILNPYREKYGYLPDRSFYLKDENLAAPRKNAVTARINDIRLANASGDTSYDDSLALYESLKANNPDQSEIIDKAMNAHKANRTSTVLDMVNGLYTNFLQEDEGDISKAIQDTVMYINQIHPGVKLPEIEEALTKVYTAGNTMSANANASDILRITNDIAKVNNRILDLKENDPKLYRYLTGNGSNNSDSTLNGILSSTNTLAAIRAELPSDLSSKEILDDNTLKNVIGYLYDRGDTPIPENLSSTDIKNTLKKNIDLVRTYVSQANKLNKDTINIGRLGSYKDKASANNLWMQVANGR